MILVVTTIPMEEPPEDQTLDRLTSLVESSLAEDGTLRYWAARDVTDPSVVRIVEQYRDAAAAEAHTATDEYRQFVEALPDLVDGEIQTLQFETDDVHDVSFTAREAVSSLD